MANIFGGVEPPAWLVKASRVGEDPGWGDVAGTLIGGLINAVKRDPNAPEGESWSKSRRGLWQGIGEARMNQADPMWRMKAAQIGSAISANNARMESATQSALMKSTEYASWEQDAPKLSGWLSLPYEQMLETPISVQSKQAAQIVSQAKANAGRFVNSSLSKEIATKDTNDFLKRVQTISPEDRAAIRSMSPNQDGTPSAQQLQALGLAEQSQAQRIQNERDLAALEAQQRGDVATTTISPKGVTTTYRTPRPEEQVQYPVPQIETFDTPTGKKSFLMYRNYAPVPVGSVPKAVDVKIKTAASNISRLQSERAKFIGPRDEKIRARYDAEISKAQAELDAIFQQISPQSSGEIKVLEITPAP